MTVENYALIDRHGRVSNTIVIDDERPDWPDTLVALQTEYAEVVPVASLELHEEATREIGTGHLRHENGKFIEAPEPEPEESE
jgi:hypothetical protein